MDDTDRIRQREHWHAIAEQLGLSPEPEDLAPQESSPPRSAISSEEEPAEEPVARPFEPVESHEAEPPPRRGRRGRSSRTEKEARVRTESGESPGEKPDYEDASERSGGRSGEAPSSKRGRRRRSARTSAASERESPDSGSSGEAPPEEGVSEDTAQRPMRRGRGRGRQKKAGTVAAEAKPENQPGQQKSTPEEAEDTELDDVRSLSDWNVPSWNELIASLYRPER